MTASIETWEQRWHPLREEWVIIAAHRDHRPWSGAKVMGGDTTIPKFDPKCPLCPGVQRSSGIVNKHYDQVFVFDNDHPCVAPFAP